MKAIKLKSPGKVNFRLDVMGKRHDGYHDIRMINSAVSIFDDVEIELIDKGIEIECENNPNVPNGEGNICYAISKEIMAYSNKNVGVRIKINKRIPAGAGMGGGSSNAATVLMGLNQLLKINLPKEKLIKIATRFGADIPFFLYGSAAIATGIGENLTKIKKLPKLPLVIVYPNVSVPTKAVYQKYKSDPKDQAEKTMEIPQEFTTKKSLIRYMRNDLESVTGKQYPVVEEIKAHLVKLGALSAQMTGSGPSVFGVFADKEKAEKVCKKIEALSEGRWQVFTAENI